MLVGDQSDYLSEVVMLIYKLWAKEKLQRDVGQEMSLVGFAGYFRSLHMMGRHCISGTQSSKMCNLLGEVWLFLVKVAVNFP